MSVRSAVLLSVALGSVTVVSVSAQEQSPLPRFGIGVELSLRNQGSLLMDGAAATYQWSPELVASVRVLKFLKAEAEFGIVKRSAEYSLETEEVLVAKAGLGALFLVRLGGSITLEPGLRAGYIGRRVDHYQTVGGGSLDGPDVDQDDYYITPCLNLEYLIADHIGVATGAELTTMVIRQEFKDNTSLTSLDWVLLLRAYF